MLKCAHLGKALTARVGTRPLFASTRLSILSQNFLATSTPPATAGSGLAAGRRNKQVRTFAMKAVFEGVTVAESDSTVIVENNHYFPPSSLKKEHFKDSSLHTTCGWKGTCNYYDVVVGDKVSKDAAWYYPDAKEKAKNIKGYVAFWKGVKVVA